MGMYTLQKGFWEDKHIFSGFHSSVMWPPTVYELVVPQELFDWPPDHMGWFAVLLLVIFKGGRMGRSDTVSLWCVSLLINTRFRIFILE